MTIENCSIDRYTAETSKKGGGFMFFLGKGGEFLMKEYLMKDCSCSMTMDGDGNPIGTSGRGGVLYLDTDVKSGVEYELNMFLKTITLTTNHATVGRDVYLRCYDASKQVNESLFEIELREGFYNRTNGIWGYSENYEETNEIKKEQDLIPLIVTYQSETIFFNSSFNNSSNPKSCGTLLFPCSSFSIGLSHLIPSFDNKIYIMKGIKVDSSSSFVNSTLKTREEKAEVVVGERVERGREVEWVGVFVCSEIVEFEKLMFTFPASCIDSSFPSSFFTSSGKLYLTSCSFSPSSSLPSSSSSSLLPFSLFSLSLLVFLFWKM
jgi:hypothetical protein